jgi:large repetitive protein
MRALRGWCLVCFVVAAACGDNHPSNVDASGPDGLPRPQCSDQRDNDGDGKIDFPNDPGCIATLVDDESDPCPDGMGCPQCGDGKDNDSNGKADFPEDTGCSSAADGIEFTDDPNACGQGMVVKPLPINGMDTGTLIGTTSNVSSPCGGGNGVPGIAYVFHLPTPRVVVASTDDPMTAIDSVLDLRTSMCATPGAELECHDDVLAASNRRSQITRPLKAGTYYLIVQGKTAADSGMYALSVRFFPGEGAGCMIDQDCGPELECRVPANQMQKQCIGPVCNDGIDDDSDGKLDYPLDPGCASPTDTTEQDVCAMAPMSPQCPQCANGVDDDADGNTDYPADTSCLAASTMNESCQQSETIGVIASQTTMGTTVGATNDYSPTCGSGTTHTAPDLAYQLDLPTMTTLNLNLTGFDGAHSLFDSSCAGAPIACSDPSLMTRTNVPAGRYYVVIDGWGSGSGAFTLTTTGTVAPGESCEGALFQSGAFTCASGFACSGTVGSRTCAPAQCNDGIDNNSDGKTDFPADPGCSSPSDGTEATVCPGLLCPVCADGLDNDNDGLTDYPLDTSCAAASSSSESCTQSETIVAITSQTTTGTTANATNDYTPTCGSTTHTAKDLAYQLDVPAMATLNIDLQGFDGAHSLLDSTCSGTPLACSDPPLLTRSNVLAGRYYVIVDGWGSGSGAFTLTTTGTVAGNGSCEGALFQSGAFTCAPGYSCTGTVGSRTCTPGACNDMMDNDADGKADYPADPGCGSRADASEADDCSPTVGPNCPACGNGLDDDMDTMTDYPADTRCPSASFFLEAFCPMEADIAGMVVTRTTTGTLATGANNFTQSCQSTTGNDASFGLRLPVPVASLQIDTIGSESSDTVVSLWNAPCMMSLGCDDDGDPAGFRSLLTVTNVPAGDYAIQVDSYGSTNNLGITLNVAGTVAAGTACTSELFASGVLACPMGTTCTSGTCQ